MGESLIGAFTRPATCGLAVLVLLGVWCSDKNATSGQSSTKPPAATKSAPEESAPARRLLEVSSEGVVSLKGSELPGCTTASPDACGRIVQQWRDTTGVDLAAGDIPVAGMRALAMALGDAGLTVGLCAEVGPNGRCQKRAAEIVLDPSEGKVDDAPKPFALLEVREDGRVSYGGEELGTCLQPGSESCSALGKKLAERLGKEAVPVVVAPKMTWRQALVVLSTVPVSTQLFFINVKPPALH